MKITDIRIDVIRRSLDTVGLATDPGQTGGAVEQGVLRVLTDDGIEGNALVGQHRGDSHPLMQQIIRGIKPLMTGRDPAEREWLWNTLDSLGGRAGVSHAAWSPVDVALWDIAGKAAGVPVHKLLGTHRYETPVYATWQPRHTAAEGYVAEAEEIKAHGFTAYKIHPGGMPTREAIRTVEMVRQAVGDDMTLMLDPNNSYDFRKAFDVGRALDDNGFYWYEDPVPWSDFDSITELSNRLATPLAMSDLAPFLFREAAHYVRLGAPRLLRGTARKLGITGLKKLCGLAEGFGRNCEIGVAGNSLLNAANLHVIMSVANCAYYEYWMPQSAHQFGLVEDIRLNERGMIDAPSGPGLGFLLDEEWISAHKVATLE
ncbi:MAG: enolase C-terminal domain-like protein [Dehalococcoidia bacterium]